MERICQQCGGDGSVQMEDGYLACYHCGQTGFCPKNCDHMRPESYSPSEDEHRKAAERRGERY